MTTPAPPTFGVKFPSRKERTVKRVTKCETREIQKRIYYFLMIFFNTLSILFKVLNRQNLFVFVHLLNRKHQKKHHHQLHFLNHQNLLVIHHLVLMYVLQHQIYLNKQHLLKSVLYKVLI